MTFFGGFQPRSIDEILESAGLPKTQSVMDKWYTKEEQEMMKVPVWRLAVAFNRVGEAMSGAVESVRKEI